jgi:hypothetical protein
VIVKLILLLMPWCGDFRVPKVSVCGLGGSSRVSWQACLRFASVFLLAAAAGVAAAAPAETERLAPDRTGHGMSVSVDEVSTY